MVQFIQLPPKRDPWLDVVGGLGNLIGTAAVGIPPAIMKKKAQKERIEKISKLPGITQQELELFPYLNPKEQELLLKNVMNRPAQQAYGSAVENLLLGSPQMMPQQGQISDQGMPQQQIPTQLNEKQFTDLARLQQKQRQLSLQEEAPERKIQAEHVGEIQKRVRSQQQMKPQYKSLIDIARSGDLDVRSGPMQQVMKKFGWEDLGLTTPQQIAQKLISNLNVERLFGLGVKGRATAKLMDQVAKTNPSLLNTPQSIERLSRLQLNALKQEEVLAKNIEKVRKQFGGRALPLGALQKAEEMSKPELKQLYKQAQSLANFFNKPEARTISNMPNPKTVKKFRDTTTGIIYESDGIQFIPVGK